LPLSAVPWRFRTTSSSSRAERNWCECDRCPWLWCRSECACMLAVQAAELVVRQAESLGGPPLMVAALGQGPLQHLDFEPGQPYAPCNTVSTATSARRTSEFDPGCTPGCVTRLASKPSPSRRGSGERIARSMALPQRSSGR
jgi:hypothetical protein